jgi:hypothetical protein
MLGAVTPIQTFSPEKITTFKDQSVVNPSQNPNQTFVENPPIVSQSSGQPDYMALIKKYAPYAIGAILLYYVISKK